MKSIKCVKKTDMLKSMTKLAQTSYETCSSDCPRCRISDG